MNIPEFITHAQMTEAFAIMGLDASEILSWSGEGRERFMTVTMRPKDANRNIEYVVVRIPYGTAPPDPKEPS